MRDIECPYCGAEQDICHDDGEGYAEDELHQQECSSCEKVFTFTSFPIWHYTPHKADCLNGADHKFEQTHTYPIECTMMECKDCSERRKPTEAEWAQINAT